MAWTKASAKKAQETKARNRLLREQGVTSEPPPKATSRPANGTLVEMVADIAEKAIAAKNEPLALRMLAVLERLV